MFSNYSLTLHVAIIFDCVLFLCNLWILLYCPQIIMHQVEQEVRIVPGHFNYNHFYIHTRKKENILNQIHPCAWWSSDRVVCPSSFSIINNICSTICFVKNLQWLSWSHRYIMQMDLDMFMRLVSTISKVGNNWQCSWSRRQGILACIAVDIWIIKLLIVAVNFCSD